MIVPRRKEPPHSTFLASQESPAFELLSETCSLRRIFLVEDGGLSDGSRDRLVDAALRKAVSLSCPEVDPFARREVDLYAVAARVEHRRYRRAKQTSSTSSISSPRSLPALITLVSHKRGRLSQTTRPTLVSPGLRGRGRVV